VHKLQAKYADKCQFLSVYISEAHAADQWKLGDKVCIKQHRTLEERIDAAKQFVKDFDFKIPMVVDSMSNKFDEQYAVWPDRFFIIENGILQLVPEPGVYGYCREVIEQWIVNRFQLNP
jgi:type I thyroxine 5'-deiodinase